jgi:phosphoenolpyruvate carboxykinase (ATP)
VTYRYNLSKEELFQAAIAGDRGRVRKGGGSDEQKAFRDEARREGAARLLHRSRLHGEAVKDTFAVAWPEVEPEVWWKADVQKFDPAKFTGLLKRVVEHLNAKKATLYVKDVLAGTDPSYSVPYRFVGEYATHAMFAHNMFPKSVQGVKNVEARRWTMLNVPTFHCVPERDGSKSDRAVVIDFKNRICLVVARPTTAAS